MKNILYLIIITIGVNINTGSREKILKQYFAQLPVIKRVYESIKVVGFKKINGLEECSFEEGTFIFKNTKLNITASFKSENFTKLYKELNDHNFFLTLLKNSTIYGIENNNTASDSQKKNGKSFKKYKIEVIILEYGEVPEDEVLIFVSDN